MKFTFIFRKVQSGLLLNKSLSANDLWLFLVFSTFHQPEFTNEKYWDLDAAWISVRSNFVQAITASLQASLCPTFAVMQCRVTHGTTGMTMNEAGKPVFLLMPQPVEVLYCTAEKGLISRA